MRCQLQTTGLIVKKVNELTSSQICSEILLYVNTVFFERCLRRDPLENRLRREHDFASKDVFHEQLSS